VTLKGTDTSQYQQGIDYLVGVFESFPAALVSLDTRLRIIMFNRSAEALTGYGWAEVARRRITAIMPLESLRSITRVLRGREELPADGFITKLRAKSGKAVPVRLVVSPLRRARGPLAGFLCVASDLGAVRRFQGKLLEAERLAALSEIAIGLNHSINNPLCAILGNTQLLLMDRDRLDPAAVRKLRSIEREISRIQQIARRLPRITRTASREYVGGKKMLDLDGSEREERPARRSKQ
jgi:PAS domain S-box-containing protein